MTSLKRILAVVFLLGLSGCSRTEAEIAEAKFNSDSFICERYNLPKIVREYSPGRKVVYCNLHGVETKPDVVLYLYSKK